MVLLEVLRRPDVVSGEMWFRPVGYRGSRVAYRVEDGRVLLAGAAGTRPALFPVLEDLLGEWEAVSPVDVLTERRRRSG